MSTGSVALAADTNVAQTNVVVLDNSTGNVAKVVDSMMVGMSLLPSAVDNYYYVLTYITGTDGIVPNFAGTVANMNTVLNQYRGNVWTTQAGLVRYNAAIPDDEIVTIEPSTKRTLRPGQKLVLCVLAFNRTATAGSLYFCYDWNLFYHY